MTLIVCPKEKGNTCKVARHLAEKSGADLLILQHQQSVDLQKYSHIVVCSGVYGDKIHAALAEWLEALDPGQLRQDVTFDIFLTWFGRGKSDAHAAKQVRNILENKGLSCREGHGRCRGGKFLLFRGHPNQADLENALAWLKREK